MTFQGFGYTVADYGSVWELDNKLRALVDAGYSHAEVKPEGWGVWQGMVVDGGRLAKFRAVLDKHRSHLDYVMHLPRQVNLFESERVVHHEHLLRLSVDVARAIGARLMVYHPGWRPQQETAHFRPMPILMAQERRVLRALVDEAAGWKGKIAIANWRHQMGGDYSYAIWPELLAQQVEAIGHPAIGVCLDLSYLHIAADWYGFDPLAAALRLAPLTIHFHVQDAIGVAEQPERIGPENGRSVTYVPPGGNDLPYAETFRQVCFPQSPVFMLDLREQFFPHIAHFLQASKQLSTRAPVTAVA